MRERLHRALPAAAGLAALAAFTVAIVVLRRELEAVSWDAITTDVLSTRPSLLAWALSLTALNYAVLTGYDFIAFASIGKQIARARVAATSFLAYAVAHNVGFSVLSGASVRYRFYSRWGVSARDLSRIVVSYSVTFWLGLLALGGLSLALSPPPAAHFWWPRLGAPLGALLMATSAGYVIAAAVRRSPIRVGSMEFRLPPARLALIQLAISAMDWTLAGAVFYVLLPQGGASFPRVLGAFLIAQLFGQASHVPGGVGVFEGLVVLLLQPSFTSAQLLPALVVYRLIYYLVPLAVALTGLFFNELHTHRAHATRLVSGAGRYADRFAHWATPGALAMLTFAGGAVLLLSGATPAAEGRLALLDRLVPLGVIETSHLLGSLAGVALLLLSQGLARRLDAAHLLAMVAVSIGIAASLFKGGDFEEALILAALLAMLLRTRRAFNRQAALFAAPFSTGWLAAVGAVLAASVWLGLFAFRHVEYARDLWWQFALGAEASRFLRSTVAAAAVVLVWAGARLLRPAPPEVEAPSDEDLRTVEAIIARQAATYPHLAFLRDKALLFDAQREAFVMYAVHGRTWVALGDPVGPPARLPELIRLFLERCDDFGGTPVFYEVGATSLHYYADFGLTFVKLGEQARVDLTRFTVDGAEGAKHRQVMRRLEKDGGTFRVVPAPEVPALLDQLESVSNDWLSAKAGAEKGFSLGSFDRDYLTRFPMAVVEHEGAIVAFANVWEGGGQHELSIDLMRYDRRAPRSTMEALLTHMLAWGQAQGYRWFAFGMAPMSGFESSPVAPLWARLGLFLYTHGEALYGFRGLRAYKEKFHPVWESRYLAYRGRLVLPRVLTDVAVLVAGGYRKVFRK